MNRATKIGLGMAGGLIALLVVAILAIPLFLDPNQYKPRAEEMLSRTLDRPVHLQGDIRLSFFPPGQLHLSRLVVENPEGFEAAPLFELAALEANARVWPLLSGKLRVDRFLLKQPRIRLIVDETGRKNWEGIGGSGPKQPPPEKTPAPSEPGQPALEGLWVKSLTIEDGYLLWQDRSAGRKQELSDWDLSLTDIAFDRAIQVALSAKRNGHPLALSGELGPVGKAVLSGTVASLPFDLKLQADPLPPIHLAGQARDLPAAPRLDLKADCAFAGKAVKLSADLGPLKDARLPLSLSLTGLDQMDIQLSGAVQGLEKQPELDISLALAPFSPRKLFADLNRPFPVETADPRAFSSLSLNGRIRGTLPQLSLEAGKLALDETQMALSLDIRQMARPDLAVDIQLDQIDLDRYLPPQKPKPDDQEQSPPPASESPADFQPLRQLVLAATLRADTLRIGGAVLSDLRLELSAKNGEIQVSPLDFTAYRGKLSLNGALDLSAQPPPSHLKLRCQGLDIGPLLRDLGQTDILSGKTQADLDLSMQGINGPAIQRSLSGKGAIRLTDGRIQGVDLARMARNVKDAYDRLLKGKAPAANPEAQTRFSDLRAELAAENGDIRIRSARLRSPFLRATAKGRADLATQTLDIRISPKFVATAKGQGDKQARQGIGVPVLVSGSFASPTFQPDLAGILKQAKDLPQTAEAAKALLKGEKGAIKEGLKKREEALTDIFKALKGDEKEQSAEKKPPQSADSLEEKAGELLKGFGF